MAKAYSVDLRERAVAQLEAGVPNGTVARFLRLGRSTIRAWRAQKERLGDVGPQPRRPARCKLDAHRERIERWVAEDRGITLEAIRAKLKDECGLTTGVTTVFKALRRWQITLKKSHSTPPSRGVRMWRPPASSSSSS